MRQRQTAPAFQRTFPDHGNAPPVRPEPAAHIGIACLVTADLVPPEVFAGSGPPEQRTVMPMPEASMDEDRSPILRKNQIGFARQLPSVESVAEPPRMQGLAEGHLRTRVRPPDRRHVAAAGLPVVDVSQRDGAAAF